MKLINRDTDYAIRALSYIGARGGALVSVSEIAKELKIPHPFLRRILQMLQKGALVASYKGRDGGFKLAKGLDEIFIASVIKIFQGPVELVDCVFRKNICDDASSCMLRKRMKKIEKHVRSELESITIASLTGHTRSPKERITR